VLRDRIGEFSSQLAGPPGAPGVSKVGRPGPQGDEKLLNFESIINLFHSKVFKEKRDPKDILDLQE